MARRLRLLRGDADLRADERVQERRLADVRPADDRDVPATEVDGGLSACRGPPGCASIAARARSRPPPARPRGGWRRARRRRDRAPSIAAFDVEHLLVRLAVRCHHRRTRGTASLRPCSHSCSARLGILAERRGIGAREHVAVARARSTARAASKPPSRNTAPSIASSASARIDGRSAAAALQLALAQAQIAAPSARRCARRARAWPGSRAPRAARDRSPSGSCGKALVERRVATTQFSTASPTNSRRSLCEAPKLRWVSAWRAAGRDWRKACQALRRSAARPSRALPRPGDARRRVAALNSKSRQARRCGRAGASLPSSTVRDDLVAVLGDLEVLGRHGIDVVRDRACASKARRMLRSVGSLVSASASVERLLHRVVLDVGRDHAEREQRDDQHHGGHEQEADHRQAALMRACRRRCP